jgi:hypothetical protein
VADQVLSSADLDEIEARANAWQAHPSGLNAYEVARHAPALLAALRAAYDRIRALETRHDSGEWQYGVRWNYAKSKGTDWTWIGTEEELVVYVAGFDGKAIAVKRWVGPVVPVQETETGQ